jgi:ectoine hydroxylase-related dioxygenase (phytanoyl-CoA dioxygenase family)
VKHKITLDYKKYKKDGFIEIHNVINVKKIEKIKKKFKKIFLNQEYSTGIHPDKVWWRKGDSNKIPRFIANAWKADHDIASLVLSKKLSEIAAKLSGWNGTKVNEDSLIWVPPKCEGLRIHQDNPFHNWHKPGGVISAWIPIIDTTKGATLEYYVGSHKSKINSIQKLHKFKKHFVNLRKGSVVFHHGDLFHGAGINKTKKERIAISIHFMKGNSQFHKTIKSPYYNRYKLQNSTKMLNEFFPETWTSKKDKSFYQV